MKVYLVTSSDYCGGCEDKDQLIGIGANLETAKNIAIDCVEPRNHAIFNTKEQAIRALKDYSVRTVYIYDRNDTCYYEYEVKDDIIADYYDGEIRITEYEVQENE